MERMSVCVSLILAVYVACRTSEVSARKMKHHRICVYSAAITFLLGVLRPGLVHSESSAVSTATGASLLPNQHHIHHSYHDKEEGGKRTYGAAPKALLCVSSLIAEKVLVMTATNKFKSQKFRTTMVTMKKKQETKYSASIMEYISGDHCVRA